MSKIMQLDWSKTAKVFSKLMQPISLLILGEQASKHLASCFPFSDFYILSCLLSCYFTGISCTFYFGQIFNEFLSSTFDFLLRFAPIMFTYHMYHVCTTHNFCFKKYSPCKYEKKLLIMPVSLTFSQQWA